jgi:hypothetical protein
MVNALTVQLYVDGVWTTYPGYESDGWSIQIGPDVESGVRPNKLTVTLQNPDLSMDPSRADSPLYGKIGRNTPIRLQMSGTTILQAEASDWQPGRSVEHTVTPAAGRSWVDVTGEGLLRRLSRWSEPIQSALRFHIGGYLAANGLTGYAPLEDPVGSTTLDQVVPGVIPGTMGGTVTLAGDAGPGGSDPCVTIGSDGKILTNFKTGPTSGYQLFFSAKLATLPTSSTFLPLATWTDSAKRTWIWYVNNTQYQWQVFDVFGTSLSVAAVSVGTLNPSHWMRYRVKVTWSAGTLQYEPAWYEQDAATIVGTTLTFAALSSTGQLRTWQADGNTWTNGAAYSHVGSVTDTTLDLGLFASSPGLQAFNGFIGELPLTRWLRLLSQYGLSGASLGTSTYPQMGRQKSGLLLDLLTECVVTDGGIMYDDPNQPTSSTVDFITRDAIANRTPRLALTRSQISPTLQRRIDDVGKVNIVTASNANGDRVVVSETSGPLSTQPPPAGIGEYRDEIDVNLRDSTTDLTNRAMLELNRGTLDRPRYDTVTVDLLANPSLAAAVNLLRPFDTITITGEEPDTIVLRVISYVRRGDGVADTVVINCVPGELTQVAVIDDTAALIDSSCSTLNAAVTSTATTLVISTYDALEAWSTTAAYDLMIAGERVGVPAGGMSAISGTGPFLQTITGAVRSKNGIVKAQATSVGGVPTAVVLADERFIF